MEKLTRDFYNRDTILVAQDLLGCHLIHRSQGIDKIGKIVEVEAYLGSHDLACHSSKGMTKRTAVMFGPPGYAYVYLIYGIYHCFNIVTEACGVGSAVLIRAVEPIQSIEGKTCGPGLVCKSMQINTSHNGCDLLGETLFVTSGETITPAHIISAPRVGVPYAKEWAHELLRYYIKDNPFVST